MDDNKAAGGKLQSEPVVMPHTQTQMVNQTLTHASSASSVEPTPTPVDDDDGGNIIIQAKSGKTSAVFQDDEGVRLYYDDVEKVATTGYGVTVNGTIETQKLHVTGISTFDGNVDINGGTIDGTTIGYAVPAQGMFTNLTATLLTSLTVSYTHLRAHET